MKTFWINVTNNCNLKCIYCYQSLKDKRKMKSEVADKIIKDIVDFSGEIRINFFGGEPFLNYEIIKYIVEKLSTYDHIKPNYAVTTNLTLLNEDIIDFVIEYNIHITGSFDGMEKSFNKTRYNKENDINYLKL